MQKLNQPISGKSALRLCGILLLAITVAAGGRFAWQKYKDRPLTVAQTKNVIRDFLQDQADVREFTPWPMEEAGTNNLVASPAADTANSNPAEKKKKKKNRPLHEQMARDFRQSIKRATDYKTTYRLIGENLARVDEFLAAQDPEQTEAGLLLAAEASRAALDPVVNGWLAARIAEAYLWPNLDHAPTSEKSDINAASLLDISEDAFKAADETDNLILNYRLLIARSDRPGKMDKLRLRLAKLIEAQGDITEAIRVLREVQDTNNPTFTRRLATFEARLQQEKPSN